MIKEGIRDIFEKQQNGFETPTQKIIRHLLTREWDRKTLKRGIKYLFERQRAKLIPEGFVDVESFDNYAGLEGCTVRRYKQELEWLGEKKPVLVAATTTFPIDLTIKPVLLSLDEFKKLFLAYDMKRAIFELFPEALAMMIGPTIRSEFDGFRGPNNGFYTIELGQKIPFRDTNPSGQRRGAFMFSTEGELAVLDDKEKWKLIRSDFKNVEYMVGCSFFFKMSDPRDLDIFDENDSPSQVSYLIQYQTKEGQIGIAHLASYTMMNRRSAKDIIDFEAQTSSWQDYVAVELEHVGGGCQVKDAMGIPVNSVGVEGLYLDLDHPDQYLVVRK